MVMQLPPAEPFEFINVKDGIYLAKGGRGANTGFFVGKNSILAIDAKMDRESTELGIKEIEKISANPVTHMIITHGDMDHVNGLDAFPKGMKIISHKATKHDMEKAFEEPDLSHLKPYLPGQAIENNLDFDFEGEIIKLIYVGRAHTSGDILVFFPKQRTVFIGDLVLLERDPLVHLHKNGSSSGLVRYLEEIVKLDVDKIIAGHCEFITKEQVKGVIKSILKKQEQVNALVKEGKNYDQIKQILNVIEIPSPPGIPRFPVMEEVIFNELTNN